MESRIHSGWGQTEGVGDGQEAGWVVFVTVGQRAEDAAAVERSRLFMLVLSLMDWRMDVLP